MSGPEPARVRDADPWFFNLEDVALRVEANEKADRLSRHRIVVIAVFVVFAFFALAWRIQGNVEEIKQGQLQDRQDRYLSCQSGLIIIGKFNTLQDELAAAEAANTLSDPTVRDRRVRAYMAAKILPLPVCGGVPQ